MVSDGDTSAHEKKDVVATTESASSTDTASEGSTTSDIGLDSAAVEQEDTTATYPDALPLPPHAPALDDADRRSFYSLNSGVASTTFHSVRQHPGGSSYAGSANDRSVASSNARPLHQQGKIANIKILSPEEIGRDNSFGYTTDDNKTSMSETGPDRAAWQSALPNAETQASDTNGSRTSVPYNPHERRVSNTRLSTNDTKMIMNISTETVPEPPVGSKGKRVSIANSAYSINEKNYKLIQRLDQASQTTASSNNTNKRGSGFTLQNFEVEDPLEESVAENRRPSVVSAVNRYANIENTQGFVGAIALAFASVPTPKSLLRRTTDFVDTQRERRTGEQAVHPTPAADIVFRREHTRTQVLKHRIKILRYLFKEYLRLGLQYICTLKGFFVTVYFLLVIAFGGMLFLLLCNAAPAMTREWGPDDKVHSPRQIWMEIDSQILNALFCITGLGLFPVRCRDLYLWIRGRYMGDIYCNSKILKIHSSWFWAGFTSDWKLLLVVILYIFNSVFQVLLCFVMWHYNRFTRPSWSTGLLIAASFLCVIIAGIVMFVEARKIKVYLFQTGRERVPGLSFGASQADVEMEREKSAPSIAPPPATSLA